MLTGSELEDEQRRRLAEGSCATLVDILDSSVS